MPFITCPTYPNHSYSDTFGYRFKGEILRYLSEDEGRVLEKYVDMALDLAKKSDCKESNYGVIIFKGDKILGKAYNYVPKLDNYSCDACPRHHMDVHKGVGFEICFSIHAEEAAINDMLITNRHSIEDSKGAKILIVRMKDGKFNRPHEQKPYCSKCSGRIYTQTLVDEVIMCSDRGFVAFGREEYHMETMKNLTENWKEQLHITEK